MKKPMRPCRHPGCFTLTGNIYCEKHIGLHQRTYSKSEYRESSARRGYGRRWRTESKQFLAEHPWCVCCMVAGRREPATEVDHIIPHKGNQKLFWDKMNWQGLCHRCHSEKTAREDGGFGRAPGVKKFETGRRRP